METILTILVTVLITVAVIGLGLGIWAIVRLTRRISELEGLCVDHRKELDNVYREFEIINTNHDKKINQVYTDYQNNVRDLHSKIDDNHREYEVTLDRRFDKVYRKINELMPQVGVIVEG
jgi:biopolymer transport protein ExbB/TolQ